MKNVKVRADLHIHSVFSDGKAAPQEIILQALRARLKIISITDHNTFKGSIEALKFLKRKNINDVVVIKGCEVRTEYGDVLILCLAEVNDNFPKRLNELIDWAKSTDCLLIPAHPFDKFRKGIGKALFRYRWDLIEVFNAGTLNPIANYKAYLVAKKLNIPGIAVSDAHVVVDIGKAYTLINVEDLNDECVFRALKKGYTVPIYKIVNFPSIDRLSWSLVRKLRLH